MSGVNRTASYRPLFTLSVPLVGVAVGVLASDAPSLALAVAVGIALTAYGVLCLIRRPSWAISMSIMFVLIAATKFRGRDADAAVAGSVDGQIIFELALYGVMAILWVRGRQLAQSVREMTGQAPLFLAGYAGLVAVSVLWSPVYELSAVRAVQVAILLGSVSAVISYLGPEKTLHILTKSFLVYVALAVSITLLFPASRTVEYEADNYSRFSWFAVHPGAVGMTLAVCSALLLCCDLYGTDDSKRKLFGLRARVYLLPVVLALLATRARTATIALLAALAVALFARFPRLGRLCALLFLVAFLGTYAVGSSVELGRFLQSGASSGGAVAEFIYRGQSASAVVGLNGRIGLWDAVVHLVKARPLLGYGYLSSRIVLIELVPWAGYAHNALAQTALDLGLIGTVLILAVVVSCFIIPSGPLRHDPVYLYSRTTTLSIATLLCVDGIASDGFAGPPGQAFMLLAICALCADRLRRRARLVRHVSP